VNFYRVLSESIVESVKTAGAAVDRLGRPKRENRAVAGPRGWAEQFSAASLDDHRARGTVDALYRAAMVRL